MTPAPPRYRLVAAAVAGAAAVVLLGACGASGTIEPVGGARPVEGSNDGGAGGPQGSESTGQEGADEAGIDVCALLDQGDLDSFGGGFELGDGEPTSADELPDVPSSDCMWTLYDPNGSMNWTFTILVERGTDSAGFEEVAADTFMETEPEELSGLGDAATYQEDLFMDGPDKKNRIAVLSGRDLVVIDNLDEARLPRDRLIELARIILDRLESA